MSEFVMALWAMTASRHQWPMPQKEPIALVQADRSRKPELNLGEQENVALRNALDRITRCSTGKLVRSHQSGLYIPETRSKCK